MCEMRTPGSSIKQAKPATGICFRIPMLSIKTKAPSRTSMRHFSTKIIEQRSFMGIGFSGK